MRPSIEKGVRLLFPNIPRLGGGNHNLHTSSTRIFVQGFLNLKALCLLYQG